jgi:hypothetical protein
VNGVRRGNSYTNYSRGYYCADHQELSLRPRAATGDPFNTGVVQPASDAEGLPHAHGGSNGNKAPHRLAR